MYLWIVLGTFMVALMSFSLPIRPDMDRTNSDTKAQVVITKFRTQHNAFKRYIESKSVKLSEMQANDEAGQSNTVVYYSGIGYSGANYFEMPTSEDPAHMLSSTIVGGANIPTTPNTFRSSTDFAKPFNKDVELADFRRFLPYGFEKAGNIVSKVYCFANNTDEAYNYSTVCEADEHFSSATDVRANCCARSDVDVYVISWQPLPSRWVQKEKGANFGTRKNPPKPTADMMAAIAKSEGYGSSFGYITWLPDEEGKPVQEDVFSWIDPRGIKRTLKRNVKILSGGMFRSTKAVAHESEEDGKVTYTMEEFVRYRPIFDVVLNDPLYFALCTRSGFTDQLSNPCLFAINKVINREEK